ncbi:MAG: diadenylate cyclase [Kiritimatiellae bacterium]|nr:diadenylate cyclase [Kiritimatiellia bacterium]
MTNVSAIAQIAILYFVFYAILKGAKGSRFGQALMGFGILAALLIAFVYLFHFDVLTRIVQFLLIYIAVSTVVIFQPEIRRILSAVGAFGFLEKPKYGPGDAATPDLVVETLIYLADKRIGALLAFERGISLRGYEETGVLLDAVFSRGLVTSIFTPPLPLHDGGAVLRNGRLSSAHCIFPVSNNPDLIANGMRHRAAVGLSEDTDALVVAVSEETGDISVARNGKLFRYTGDQRAESLRRWLARTLPRADGGGSRLGALRKWLRKSADASLKGDRK